VKRVLPLAGLALICIVGCSSSTSRSDPYRPQGKVDRFSNTDWSIVLSRVVTPEGWVRWEALADNDQGVRENLLRYVGLLAVASPENRPGLFATAAASADEDESDRNRLAYWINAYNALSMCAAMEHQAARKAAFTVGGAEMTLEQVKDGKLRAAGDPRVHFALNDGTRSAPKLCSEPYEGAKLRQQLTDDGRRFLSDPYGAVRDGANVRISAIFKDYAGDFVAGYESRAGHRPAGLLQAIELYAAPGSPVIGAKGYTFMVYDRSRNTPM
jgi:hypothetical protein